MSLVKKRKLNDFEAEQQYDVESHTMKLTGKYWGTTKPPSRNTTLKETVVVFK